jgi:SAM-dependent methyltransferase
MEDTRTTPANPVEGHYTTGTLGARLLAALQSAGYDIDHLDPDALAPVEEFHSLGRQASIALADVARITAQDRVLDAGCGIGGPARYLTRRFGCQVTGIDLTAEFCDVARDLNARCGLNGIEIRQTDALHLPFADAAFDVVWTQHVAMNIADKPALYRSFRRVLKPGGQLALFDIVAGPEQPIHFPVPWAETPAVSFLEPAAAIRGHIEAAGFTVSHWEDVTDAARAFFQAVASAPAPSASPLGMHLIVPNLPVKAGNLGRNIAEQRVRMVRCVASVRDALS